MFDWERVNALVIATQMKDATREFLVCRELAGPTYTNSLGHQPTKKNRSFSLSSPSVCLLWLFLCSGFWGVRVTNASTFTTIVAIFSVRPALGSSCWRWTIVPRTMDITKEIRSHPFASCFILGDLRVCIANVATFSFLWDISSLRPPLQSITRATGLVLLEMDTLISIDRLQSTLILLFVLWPDDSVDWCKIESILLTSRDLHWSLLNMHPIMPVTRDSGFIACSLIMAFVRVSSDCYRFLWYNILDNKSICAPYFCLITIDIFLPPSCLWIPDKIRHLHCRQE